MLAQGTIEASQSPYSSPILLVPKKHGKHRFCIDYRRINEVTESEPTPMPIISETLRDLGKAKVFSTLDLKNGYWQIPMHADSKEYTAFSTPDGGKYHFNFMPFGLKNAPCTFQRIITQEVLVGYMRHFCLAYLDDIIVYSSHIQEHLYHLSLIFERLQLHGLRLALEKCVFGRTSLDYLGHTIVSEVTTPQTKHIGQVMDFPAPKNRKELRAFIGTCGWIRDYLPNFAETAAPLTDLLSPKRPYQWTNAANEAFNNVKQLLQRPLELSRPDPELPYVLQTDASGIGIAAVLFQREGDTRRIIAYASARLTAAERKFHINELECLALIWAVKKYRPLLESNHFKVITDSSALTWLNRFKDSKAKLLRWSVLLQEFDFDIEHTPGKANELPDFLSRNPDNVSPGSYEDVDRMLPPEANPAPPLAELNAIIQRTTADYVIETQLDDPVTQRLIHRMGQPNDKDRQLLDRLEIVNGQLWKKADTTGPSRIYVPMSAEQRVLNDMHDESGHPGRDETIRAVEQLYYFPKQRKRTREYVRQCIICAAVKRGPLQQRAPLKPRIPIRPWQTVSVDLMGPYPKTTSGKAFILVVNDLFTKWTEAFAINTIKLHTIARLLNENVFQRYGYPEAIITDNGPQFSGHRWQTHCRKWGCHNFYTPIYHPRSNPVERRNQEIKKGLRTRLQNRPHTDWAKFLPEILFDLRTRANAATKVTPSYALLGYELPKPGDWQLRRYETTDMERIEKREERLDQIRERQLTYVQKYEGEGEPPPFNEGDNVMVRNHVQSDEAKKITKGFAPKWLGPYAIRNIFSGRVYTVNQDGREVRVHADDVRPAPPPPDPLPPASPVSVGTDRDSDREEHNREQTDT